MFRFIWTRASRLILTLTAVAILVGPSAEAQRKKPKKRPAATAKPRPKATKPAAPEAAPAPEATPEEEAEPPPSKTKPPKPVDAEEKPPESSEETERPAEVDRDKDRDKDARLGSLLDLEIGMKGFQRHLVYQGDVNNVLPDYDLGVAPAVALAFGFYPIRTKTGSMSAGITGGFESGFSMGTTYREPQPGLDGTHDTTATAYSVGARVNFNFGSNTVGVGGEYGVQNYKIDLPPPTPGNAQVPAVSYHMIRPNVTGRFGLGSKVSLLAGVGYLYVLSAGDIVSASYFRGPITTASGFDLDIGLGWSPFTGTLKNVELRPMFAWRRIAFTFNTDSNNPDDHYIASGAHDDFLSLALMIGLRL